MNEQATCSTAGLRDRNEKLTVDLYEYKKNCINNILQTVNKHSYISLHQRPTRTAGCYKIVEHACRVSWSNNL